MEWQPIETARAGVVLVCAPSPTTDDWLYAVAYKHHDPSWGAKDGVWRIAERHGRALSWQPTHWTPLLEPPKSED